MRRRWRPSVLAKVQPPPAQARRKTAQGCNGRGVKTLPPGAGGSTGASTSTLALDHSACLAVAMHLLDYITGQPPSQCVERSCDVGWLSLPPHLSRLTPAHLTSQPPQEALRDQANPRRVRTCRLVYSQAWLNPADPGCTRRCRRGGFAVVKQATALDTGREVRFGLTRRLLGACIRSCCTAARYRPCPCHRR